MGNSSIKRHFEMAEKTGVLNLSKSKLSEFPKKLDNLTSILRTIDLSDNSISYIPQDIESFKFLKSLACNNNKLTHLPEEIGQLNKLETLSLIGNKLESIPSKMSQLVNLKYLYLSGNKLKDFPLNLCGLKHIDVIDVSNNLIESIPVGIGELRATELNVNQNRVSFLSDDIADCPRLKTLRLEENCLHLTSIPRRLLEESKISLLTLEGNLFEMKSLTDVQGYDSYMERYTAVKKKMF